MLIETFSKKQVEILKFAYSDEETLICDGAVRSGKTVVMVLAFTLWAMTNFDKTNFAICGKTVSNAERNILRPFESVEGLPFTLKYKISTRMLTIQCGKKENYFYLFGGKDESSYALIQGITLAGVLFDEVALMPQSFVDQAIARTLSFKNAKIWFNCNPESPNHWFHTDWIKNNKKPKKHLHFLMNDNPTLGADEIKRAETLFTGVFYERFILGRWVAAEGACYPLFANDKEKYIIKDIEKDKIQFATIGVDFGGDKSAHAFILTGYTKNLKEVITLDEFYLKKRISPAELEDKFIRFVRKAQEKYRVYDAYCDSAETTLIEGFRAAVYKAGIPIDIRPAKKTNIIDRIRFYNALQSQGRYFVLSHCKNLIEAFCTAVYDSKSLDDKRLDDGSVNIDSLDAAEYSTEVFMKDIIGM